MSCKWIDRVVLLFAMLRLCDPCGQNISKAAAAEPTTRPHIILVMADDQGWAETSYNHHGLLKTPHLDALAAEGLRFNRFYAAAPVCSPTRATVLTGRTNDRTGVISHGYALRRQEITIAQLLRGAGYVTGHFGKWHLNGLRGPGVPVLRDDSHHPGQFGFDHWLSTTNYFDRDPILSRMGKFQEFPGDSSEVVVDQALEFIEQQLPTRSPTFTVIWYGTPHHPFKATAADMAAFEGVDASARHHFGELVAMDRSIGGLQSGLRRLGIQRNTLIWYCSDNGGLPKIRPSTVGSLRGYKGSVYEGGLRVPGVIHWPGRIQAPRQTDFPAFAGDILPTLLSIASITYPTADRPIDGINLEPVFDQDSATRDRPIFVRHLGKAALIDNQWKLLTDDITQNQVELYDVVSDPSESTNLIKQHTAVAKRMQSLMDQWNQSVDASFAGQDYPEGRVDDDQPPSRFWTSVAGYQAYLDHWQKRWEYRDWLKSRNK